MKRKHKVTSVKSMMVEVSGMPDSWTQRTCKIDGDKISAKHRPTWGVRDGEPAWYCSRCGVRMEHPLRA